MAVASSRTSPRTGGRGTTRKTGSSRSGSTRASGARSSGPAARATGKPLPKGLLNESRQFLGEHLGSQSDDIWGVGLILVGILTFLGIAFDATGILGRIVRFLTEAMLGQAKLALPIVLVWLGYLLVRGRPREKPIRVLIGAVFCTVSLSGLLHLAKGAPRWGSPRTSRPS